MSTLWRLYRHPARYMSARYMSAHYMSTIHEYPENTTRAQPCSGIGASHGARALCTLLGRTPLLTSLRLRRSDASNAAGPAVAAYGCQRRTDAARASIAARGRPHLAPRSARRSDTLTSLRAPRVARALQTQPGQQWQRTAESQRRTDAARAGIAARGGRPHLAPRSARRSDAPSDHHLAPRSARRSERTAPRALRARGAVRGALARRAGALRPRP